MKIDELPIPDNAQLRKTFASFEHVQAAVGCAMTSFYASNDLRLLRDDVNEPTICQKLACHLAQQFCGGWDVDVEYNKNTSATKRLERHIGTLIRRASLSQGQMKEPPTVYPDIVVHERGEPNNLLVIEVKKTSTVVSSRVDYRKLICFTDGRNRTPDEPHYQYGLFMCLGVSNRLSDGYGLQWFHGGHRLGEGVQIPVKQQ